MYLSSAHEPTLQKIKSGGGDPSWLPVVVYPRVRWGDRTFGNKIIYFIFKMAKILYAIVYFYFLPYCIFLLNYAY
jgi:hypothetical protein